MQLCIWLVSSYKENKMKISFERDEFVKNKGLNLIGELEDLNYEELLEDEAISFILDDIIMLAEINEEKGE